MILKNEVINRLNNKPIIYDLFFDEHKTMQPLVIFSHGYKGFKDWGAWDLVAKQFMAEGLAFLKFNFSYNGGTIKNPIDFPDLEAFSENNYSKELDDLNDVIHFSIEELSQYSKQIDFNRIILIGHSRGGGISILTASENSEVSKLITWASVCNFKNRFGTEAEIKAWETSGVKYVTNARTKQEMPHHFQFYKDFIENENRLNIKKATANLSQPHLIIHAAEDKAVSIHEAKKLQLWNPKAKLITINESNHVFGAKHPWGLNDLPQSLREVVNLSINFIKQD